MRASLLNYTVEAEIFLGNFISLISLLLQINEIKSMTSFQPKYLLLQIDYNMTKLNSNFYGLTKKCASTVLTKHAH